MIATNMVLFSILITIAFAVLYKLIKTKDEGRLRKIMIWYFAAEIFLMCALLFLEVNYGEMVLPQTQYIIFIAILPKVIVKVIFFGYIIDKN